MVGYPRGVRPDKTGKKIEIRFHLHGRSYSETLDLRPTSTGLAQAANIRAERLNTLRYGPSIQTESMTFGEAAQRYLDTTPLAKSTRNSYRDALNIYWMPVLGHLALRSIRYATLKRLDEQIQWQSPKTRANVITALRQVFRYALACDLIDHNPALKFPLQRQQPAGPDPYSLTERNRLLEALEDTYAGFYFHLALVPACARASSWRSPGPIGEMMRSMCTAPRYAGRSKRAPKPTARGA